MADWYKSSLTNGVSQNGHSHHQQQQAEQVDDDGKDPLPFSSRRSPVLCRHAVVASGQPLASGIGLDLIRNHGANAADAAVAVAAVLAVTEPCSTGLGGDMFCLYYDAQKREVSCINASGPSPAALTLERIQEAHPAKTKVTSNGIKNHNNDVVNNKVQKTNHKDVDTAAFRDSPLTVTVPGAARGWEDLLKRHGSGNLTLAQVLEPAAVLAEEGFPVGPITSYQWTAGMPQITKWLDDDDDDAQKVVPLTVDGKRAPKTGEIMVNADMARVLRDLGERGATEGFYRGATGKAIIDAVRKHGGCMTEADLAGFTSSDFPSPISAEYRGCKLWQVPPNGQGIAGLIALSGLGHLESKGIAKPISPATIGGTGAYHAMMEMMRLGFADARAHVADPRYLKVQPADLLDPTRIGSRAEKLFEPAKAVVQGAPDASSCTVSFQVVDQRGNAVSFVNSNFMGFGTGIVPDGCGFTLQNRGFGFSLEEGHPNCVGPSKRPYHTIIPGMLTHADTNELYASISNMGGNMQPQGHLQLTVDMLAGGLDPQAAIDMPRFCIVDGTQGGIAFLERGVPESVVDELRRMGHDVRADVGGYERSVFGRAQIIKRDRRTGVLWAGSDGRADGCAIGF